VCHRLRLRQFFQVVKKRTVRTLGFLRKHAIALIALTVSVLGSLHMTSKFFVYYFYTPPLDIFIGADFNKTTLKWSDIFMAKGLKL
jgi:hypothetical protein